MNKLAAFFEGFEKGLQVLILFALVVLVIRGLSLFF
jgi:hypothetical protein